MRRRFSFFSFLFLVSTSKELQRELAGRINGKNFERVQMTIDLVEQKTHLKQVEEKLVDFFSNLLPFLLSPSYLSLTTMKNNLNKSSSTICRMDKIFQRHLIISFSDGKYENEKNRQMKEITIFFHFFEVLI